jgi:hypothetical protein
MAEEHQEEGRSLPIKWTFPPDLVSRAATNITIQHSEHEFTISFFEVQTPILLGTPEEIQSQLEQMESVPMICVARVIISATRMEGFLEALQKNFTQYQSKVKKSE